MHNFGSKETERWIRAANRALNVRREIRGSYNAYYDQIGCRYKAGRILLIYQINVLFCSLMLSRPVFVSFVRFVFHCRLIKFCELGESV